MKKTKHDRPLRFIPLQLCVLDDPPSGNDWLHEIKLDGYRIEAIIDQGHVQLLSRNQKDWTTRFSSIAKALENFPAERAILDGEVVVLDEEGVSRFQLLQNSLDQKKPAQLHYYVIDIMYYEDDFVLNAPLIERKKLIKKIFKTWRKKSKQILNSDFIEGDGSLVFEEACRHGLEGIISKRINSHYRSKRTTDWIKAKCLLEQEFVIGGFSDPKGGRTGFGALALGFYDNNRLIYCGNVGTGFSEETLKKLFLLLHEREQKKSPFVDDTPGKIHFVKPDLVAQIRFSEWTKDKLLRQPVFLGLRLDKSARKVVRENRQPHKKNREKIKPSSQKAGVIITNPDKKLYEHPPVTKQMLADFYEAICEWILPHIINRPLSLFRCPNGIKEKGFFQKHRVGTLPEGIYAIKTPVEDEPYLMIKDLQGLISLVQIAALEIHPWNSQKGSLSKPDRIIFDLDPGDQVDFVEVKKAARMLREILSSEYFLESFLKTTGGKGLHVVVPIIPSMSHKDATECAKKIAEILVKQSPEKFLLTMKKSLRRGKIFIDYLRNPQGSTAIAPYSLRARPGATVATPLSWEELGRLKSAEQYTIENLLSRLKRLKSDPWEDFFLVKQKMPKI